MFRYNGNFNKPLCIHMNCAQSLAYASSKDGSAPLTHPLTITRSSRDSNWGLYPRAPRTSKAWRNSPYHHSNTNRGHRHGKKVAAEILYTNKDAQFVNSACTINAWNPVNIDSGGDASSICYSRNSSHSINQNRLFGEHKMAVREDKPPKQVANHSNFGFVSARTVMDPMRELLNLDGSPVKQEVKTETWSNSPRKESPQKSWGVKRKRTIRCNQNNKLTNYFSVSPNSSPPKSASSTATSQTNKSQMVCAKDSYLDNIRLDPSDQTQNLVFPSASEVEIHSQNIKQENQEPAKKSKTSDSKSKKKKLPEPRFNRNNQFLYSGPPVVSQNNINRTNYSDKYGLLGTGAVPIDKKVDYFSQLPLEVIENVFCRLPLMDLCLNLTRVCSKWNDIISEENFLKWKKMYFRILRVDKGQRHHLVHIMNDNGMNLVSLKSVLPSLIRYMKNFKPVTSLNMTECLSKHAKYSCAAALIKERLPGCLINQEPQPWCVITALVLLSETVDDISDIISRLLGSQSQCTATEVLECMYCIAAFLLQLKTFKYRDVWTGMHYRLYYALYVFENESSATCEQLREAFTHSAGQQTILKYSAGDASVRYTHEQLRICNHNVADGEILKIVAFAGTGKTTTLLRYTQLRPELRFLLILYNKSVQVHCSGCFPLNVTCKTSHGLAMSSRVGRRYGHKIGNFRVSGIAQLIQSRKGENLYEQAKFVMDTINTFMASADRTIDLSHVPMVSVNDAGLSVFLGTERRERLAEDATMIWERATNPRDMEVRLPHDGYLKVYQLSQPQLTGYDVILIDEAQDLTPAVIDIVLQQTQPKILVGDPNQQIYSFRGAVNAMDIITATTTYYLTQSFRFGSQIAFVANSCLELLKGEHKKILVGSSQKGTIMGEQFGQLAIITRSNFTLFAEAVKKCCFSNEKVRIAFAGGTDAFGFDMIKDIYMLLLTPEDRAKEKHKIQHPLVKKFNNFGDLEKFAKKTSDNELLGKLKIVKTYQHQLPSVINKILEKCVNDMTFADVVFSTTHKAKGLEFPTVRVTDDFVSDFLPAEAQGVGLSAVPPDEYNLLYVAVTRAKKSLQLSPTLMRILDYSGEKFRYSRLSTDLVQQGPDLRCMLTDSVFKPCALTLARNTLTLGGGTVQASGYYSPQVILEDIPSLSGLYGALKDQRGKGGQRTRRTRQDARWEDLNILDYVLDEDDEDMMAV